MKNICNLDEVVNYSAKFLNLLDFLAQFSPRYHRQNQNRQNANINAIFAFGLRATFGLIHTFHADCLLFGCCMECGYSALRLLIVVVVVVVNVVFIIVIMTLQFHVVSLVYVHTWGGNRQLQLLVYLSLSSDLDFMSPFLTTLTTVKIIQFGAFSHLTVLLTNLFGVMSSYSRRICPIFMFASSSHSQQVSKSARHLSANRFRRYHYFHLKFPYTYLHFNLKTIIHTLLCVCEF